MLLPNGNKFLNIRPLTFIQALKDSAQYEDVEKPRIEKQLSKTTTRPKNIEGSYLGKVRAEPILLFTLSW